MRICGAGVATAAASPLAPRDRSTPAIAVLPKLQDVPMRRACPCQRRFGPKVPARCSSGLCPGATIQGEVVSETKELPWETTTAESSS